MLFRFYELVEIIACLNDVINIFCSKHLKYHFHGKRVFVFSVFLFNVSKSSVVSEICSHLNICILQILVFKPKTLNF